MYSLLHSLYREKELWLLFNGDLLPTAERWVDNSGQSYRTFMWQPLLYGNIVKITAFLLGNGVNPDLVIEWFTIKSATRKDINTIKYIARQYALGNDKYFYWDLHDNTWFTFAGRKR